MTKPRVLISDKMDPNAARIFTEMGCDVDVITGETPEQLIARIGDYDGLAIRSSTKVTKEILAAATNLTDRKYWNWSDVRGVTQTAELAAIDAYSLPGRNLRLTLVVDF